MVSQVPVTRKTISALPWISAALVLYLLLFSTFALYHAYAENELIDSHGCQIGQWVQHTQVTVIIVVFVSAALAPVLLSLPMFHCSYHRPFRATASLRGPPSLFALL
jgi:hypothetical protein